MPALRFRVKSAWNPRGLWRDIVIGENRTLEDLHRGINHGFGLDFDHLWFFARGQKYWGSGARFVHPVELEEAYYDEWPGVRGEARDAGETPLSDLNLKVRDRLSYLFDYGGEWRFYMILKGEIEDEPSDKEPEVVKGEGEKIENQYGPGLPR
ncbi:hypothetical protein AKJ44_00515 [candidate division MSBL1 archaeon SCGC-AAA261F17]|uniref:Plasmid pRiA4b Orf3-like domain-containing protein n=1 Tax=candidate division MSBL1 archaeon SCGC-AAA261F17 TaxID=1698274 RepID=A0A133V7L8_9EURY|nr:hypothetical protein AKJ44_00515 [candidate division MSBL1 archaeon SCGC-AAA261F17]